MRDSGREGGWTWLLVRRKDEENITWWLNDGGGVSLMKSSCCSAKTVPENAKDEGDGGAVI